MFSVIAYNRYVVSCGGRLFVSELYKHAAIRGDNSVGGSHSAYMQSLLTEQSVMQGSHLGGRLLWLAKCLKRTIYCMF